MAFFTLIFILSLTFFLYVLFQLLTGKAHAERDTYWTEERVDFRIK